VVVWSGEGLIDKIWHVGAFVPRRMPPSVRALASHELTPASFPTPQTVRQNLPCGWVPRRPPPSARPRPASSL